MIGNRVHADAWSLGRGVRSVQPKLGWSARAAGVVRLAVVFTVLLLSTLGSILTGRCTGLAVNMFVPLVLISSIGLCLNSSLQNVRRRHASAGR